MVAWLIGLDWMNPQLEIIDEPRLGKPEKLRDTLAKMCAMGNVRSSVFEQSQAW
jgi:hypothetical protein